MSAFRGNNWRVGFGHQVSEGTLVAPTQHYKWLQGTSVDPDVKLQEIYEGDGGIDMSFVNKDQSMWKGKVQCYARSVDVGMLVSALMGTSSETLKTQAITATLANAATGGTVPAGVYHAAWAYTYGQVQGIASADLTTTTTGAISTISLNSIPNDADASGIRLFLGNPGGSASVYPNYVDFAYTPSVTTSVTYTGTPAQTAFAAGAITASLTGGMHYFKPQTTLDFWTCEYGQTTSLSNQIRERIADVMFNKLTIESDPGKPVKITAEFIGKYSQAQASLQAAVFDSGTALHMANSTFVVDGTLSLFVGKFKLEYSTMLDDSLIYTHLWPETFIVKQRRVQVDYDLLFQDASSFHKFLSGGATTNPTAGSTIDNAQIATGSLDLRFNASGGNDQTNALGITIPNLNYAVKPVTPNLDGKAFIQPVSGFAVKSAANFCNVQVRNGQSTAY